MVIVCKRPSSDSFIPSVFVHQLTFLDHRTANGASTLIAIKFVVSVWAVSLFILYANRPDVKDSNMV